METPLTDAFCQQNELNEPQRQLLAAFDEVDNFWAEKAKEEEASQKSVNEGGKISITNHRPILKPMPRPTTPTLCAA